MGCEPPPVEICDLPPGPGKGRTYNWRFPYDVVFMDCQMPGMDGFVATDRIGQLEGHARHTPIIAMTANAMDEDRDRCLLAGMDDYVAKPVRPERLKETLDKWLVGRESTQPARALNSGSSPGNTS
jgi:CheY-like chemotaxis protein